ncbi:uncharacterized protein CC84DRAFT_1259057 [Paraphaeosphaeria sporulosa]|uniref:Subtelomeric hrmA-associated cluster protein AFUB-079030/YDR124W-like helical bundle domain-containing protein n=1 Tax=Paraphaeosphaeria sporulosa TaxID=1460663 RepID=A0A177CFS0_9PLEO|nr:uncharacterized protein CC84DRAFT_1259057 [Paraphaeosphaeria sporulosa]OAG05658.1 hypothetical protein CC84DRAFT_1259057 [Paraphaeosphaeria sporulosa]
MAKGNMQQFIHEPFSCQTRHGATHQTQCDAEIFSLVRNSDYVPPKPSESRAGEEPTAPLESRIALGYLTVNGREEPVFAPIQGFEHLFAHADVAAPWPQQSGETQATATTAAPTTTTTTTHPPSVAAPSKKSRMRKRRRTRSQSHHCLQAKAAVVEDCEAAQVPKTFSIGDVNSLQTFYATRFRELTMKPMRDIVTAWVKRLEPKRQKKYGPYQRYDLDPRSDKVKSIKPRWWPADIPYVEPSHLKLEHLVPLAVDFMLVHRLVDEEVGKRKYASWIDQLQMDAVYLISSKDTEHFSSSKGTKYNEAMKRRALEIILPSIFDVAKSHEDYIAQYDLYEGSGNMDPGCGKQVSWLATPRPDRGLVFKRRARRSIKVEPLSDDEGDLTEVDEEAFEQSSTYSSFHSTEGASEPSSTVSSFHSTEEAAQPSSALSSFGSTLSFDSAFSYTEDVKMFPDDLRMDPSPAPEQTSSQCLYQALTTTSEGTMVPTIGRPMERLQGYETDSKAHSAFGMTSSATDLISHCRTGLPYGYSNYPHMTQAPFPVHESNGFSTCGPLVPHKIAAVNDHGLPNSSQLHGLPLQQQQPTHSYDSHGLPLAMDWIDEL